MRGVSRKLWHKFRLDANFYRRYVNNYADDDQIANTTISFPISFREGHYLWGRSENRSPNWHGLSGSRVIPTWSEMYGFPYGRPVSRWRCIRCRGTTGRALSGFAGSAQHRFYPVEVSDQSLVFGSPQVFNTAVGLPFEFDGDPETVLEEYGQQVLNRINFARGRIYPALIVSCSAGVDVYKSDRMNMRLSG